jgi:hypothetical protein
MFYYKRNYYKLNIDNKSYKLVYKIKKYHKEHNSLKKILINEKIIPISQRFKIVNAILNNVYRNGKSLINYIDFQWNIYNFHKLTTDILNDEIFIILEILSSYLIYDNKKDIDNTIITHKKLNNYVYNKDFSFKKAFLESFYIKDDNKFYIDNNLEFDEENLNTKLV